MHAGVGVADYWTIKIDSLGNILWQKCYGGTSDDRANSIQQTLDGGYIIAGESQSNDGDASINNGGYDYWIIKTDSTGIIQWEKSFGGSKYDQATSVIQTKDNSFIIAGRSTSNNGDVTGHHLEQSPNAVEDYWLVKLMNQPTSVKPFNIVNSILYYPNPTSDQFFIDANTTDKLTVDLYDVNGRRVFKASVRNNESINVATLDNGTYTLTIKTADRIINKKLVILR